MKKIFLFFVLCLGLLVLFGCGDQVKPVIKVSDELEVGKEYSLEVEYNGKETIVWSVDNDLVAEIKDNKLIIKTDGSFNLKVTCGDVSDTLLIIVPKVASYSITYINNGYGIGLDMVNGVTKLPTELPTLSQDGYRFLGWYLDSNFATIAVAGSSLTSDVTLYAKWEEITYTISFNINNHGELPETKTNLLEIPSDLPVLKEPGMVFDGWYLDVELTERAVVKTKLTSDITLYAKWEEVKMTYDVTYMLDGGTNSVNNLSTYEIGTKVTLSDPVKEGFIFNGWYLTDDFTLEKVEEISETNTTNITLYACWIDENKEFNIVYNLNGGNLTYQSLNDVINAFFKDYNSTLNKGYSSINDIKTSNFSDIDYHTFYTKTLSDGTSVRDKWLWLAQYLYEVSAKKLASNNCNVLGLKSLINNTSYSSDGTFGVAYAFKAFLLETTIRPGTSYTSVDFSLVENSHGFFPTLSKYEKNTFKNNTGSITLKKAYLEGRDFVGWYLTDDFTGDAVVEVSSKNINQGSDTVNVYAKFVEGINVSEVKITNKVGEIKRFETLQLVWNITPSNATVQTVKFTSSNPNVLSVTSNGIITALSNGEATITITSQSQSKESDTMKVLVYSPDHFDIAYDGESYITVGGQTKVVCDYTTKDGNKSNITWVSLNQDIVTVDGNGVCTGVKVGSATIRAKVSETVYQDIIVDVIDSNLSSALKQVLAQHESNVYTEYELGIGAGTPAYYRDIYGSVSKSLYSDYVCNTKYESVQAGISSNHGGTKSSTEFITVHYTGNMSPNATANANASYFANGGSGTSIHYVTGNDGVYHVLDDSLIGYHAGDGTAVSFGWIPTGVTYQTTDPQWPVWGISSNSKFMINGVETTVSVPTGTTTETKKVTGNTFVYNGVTQNCINDMGLGFMIKDGQYYMGTTWWCYSQVKAGRICSKGGNLNSIGIESAVNPESDLWLTWQMTAQLVARLMLENDLDITRVVGHHFFTAKDCPQPLLENNLEIWWKFIDMVEEEYKLITTFKDYKFEIISHSAGVSDNGRVTCGENANNIEYTVKVTNTKTNESETITLHSAVNGIYSK